MKDISANRKDSSVYLLLGCVNWKDAGPNQLQLLNSYLVIVWKDLFLIEPFKPALVLFNQMDKYDIAYLFTCSWWLFSGL